MRRLIARLLTLIGGLALFGPVPAQEISGRINEEIEYFFPDQFMGSVLLGQADQLLYSEQFGFANVAQQTPINENSLFQIASLTKQFTAAAILLLEEQGVLNLQDSITTHVGGLPGSLDGISLLNLLAHSSGIPDIPNSAFVSDERGSVFLSEAEFARIAPESAPGSQVKYSNTGYHLLGEVIEAASEVSYTDFITENLLSPLRLENTGFLSTNIQTVDGHVPDQGQLVPQESSDAENLGPYSAGGMYSTAADLHVWTTALMSGQVISQSSLDKMTSVQNGFYALGLMVSSENERQRIYHTGSIFGFAASLSYFPDRNYSLVVLSNVNDRDGGGDAELIAKSIEFIIYDDDVVLSSMLEEIKFPQTLQNAFVGDYEMQSGRGGLSVTATEESLFLQFTGDTSQYRLRPFTENKFHMGVPFIHYEFMKDETGVVSSVVLNQRGSKFMFMRQ